MQPTQMHRRTERGRSVTRLIFSGLYDELPGLKIITHHMGGMIPFYAGKIELGFDQIFHGKAGENPVARKAGLKKRPVEYYRMIYADTALNGSALMAGKRRPPWLGECFD